MPFFWSGERQAENATVDAALKAIGRFETSTNRKPFRKLHIEQARAFRAQLIEELGARRQALEHGDCHLHAEALPQFLPLAGHAFPILA